MSHLVHGHHGYLVLWRRDGHAAPNVDGGAGGGERRPQVACVGAVHIGVRRDGPSHLLVGGEVPRSILLLLELSEAGSVVEPAIHILGTVPEQDSSFISMFFQLQLYVLNYTSGCERSPLWPCRWGTRMT